MIRTVTVSTGESAYAKAAQQHAIETARLFSARLKIVGIWDAAKDAAEVPGGESVGEMVTGNRERVSEAAARAGVSVVESLRGEGMTRGLLEEARETDLLVIGMPTESQSESDRAAAKLIKNELPVLRKADCALLVVNAPPEPLKNILACYDGSSYGKAMLRMAGAIGEKYEAGIGILVMGSDVASATELGASAKEYLAGFRLPSVLTIPRKSPGDYKGEILKEAEKYEAGLIAMGERDHGLLEHFFGNDTAERTALATAIPLLIAR